MSSIPRLFSASALVLVACGQPLPGDEAAAEGGLESESHYGDCRPVPRIGEFIQGRELLVAIEDGGAVTLDPRRGTIVRRYATGPNAFGAVYSTDGRRAFVTDKTAGTLSELDRRQERMLSAMALGTTPQQPGTTADGRMYVPLSGEGAVAVLDISGAPRLLRKIDLGTGSKPHIVSVQGDSKQVWATVQGVDPRVVSIEVTKAGEEAPTSYRYDLVPRVIAAGQNAALFTAHHSTGLHLAEVAGTKLSTPYMDVFGAGSEARKQIEGIAISADGKLASLTHEGRKALVALRVAAGRTSIVRDIRGLSASPYWTTLDPSGQVAYVSIPGSGTVEAHSLTSCSRAPLWVATVGGKPKRMAVTAVGQ